MPEMTDEEIVVAVQRGNEKLFGALVERYEGKLMRYAKRFLLEEEDAKDLVQDVFIKGYTNIQSFDASRRFSPWIYRIAHNEFINALRKRKGKESVSLFDFDVLLPHPVAQETAEGEAERKEIKQMLERSLKELDAKYREPLVLYYFEDMDYREIGDVLGIPTSTVGVRLRRGKLMLRKQVAPFHKPYGK